MSFEFATATRIVFGEGKRAEAIPAIAAIGKRALVVTGKNRARCQWLTDELSKSGIEWETVSIEQEPTIEDAERGAVLARSHRAEVVIAVGGGSVIDGGKAIAALATNPEPALTYLEVIGEGKPLLNRPLPIVAIPTTAGTGAEVTRNAVLTSKGNRVKVSLRNNGMFPTVAIVDPELTYDLPASLTAATGMDALTQLFEPFVCARANPMTDALCREGLGLAGKALRKAFKEPRNGEARRDMALASLLGGMALTNAGLGAVHGFAAPIGGMFNAPHGEVCAALLPHVMLKNYGVAEKEGRVEVLTRFREAAGLLMREFEPLDGITWVKETCKQLQIRRLSAWGITPADVPEIAARAARASSMKANPVQLSSQDLEQIVRSAL